MAIQYGGAESLQVQLKGPYGSVSIRAAELSLLPDGWKGAVSPYAQEVGLEGITATCKVDIQPDPGQLEQLRRWGTGLMAVNDTGVLTVYALGEKPREAMTLQATIMEVQR